MQDSFGGMSPPKAARKPVDIFDDFACENKQNAEEDEFEKERINQTLLDELNVSDSDMESVSDMEDNANAKNFAEDDLKLTDDSNSSSGSDSDSSSASGSVADGNSYQSEFNDN